jgi:hypothetical protein
MKTRYFPSLQARWAFLLLAILAIASCSDAGPSYFDVWKYSFNDGGQAFASLPALCSWIKKDIRYDSDADLWGFSEYWASPEQTLSRKSGDCDDDAILFMYFAHTRNLALDSELVGVQITPSVGHAIVRVGDMYYDPTNGIWGPFSSITSNILFTMEYDEALFVATHGHDASKSLAGGAGRVPLDSGNCWRLDSGNCWRLDSPYCWRLDSHLDRQCYTVIQTPSKESHDGVTITSSADLKSRESSSNKVDYLRGSTAGR